MSTVDTSKQYRVRHSILAYTVYEHDEIAEETIARREFANRGAVITVQNPRELAMFLREQAVLEVPEGEDTVALDAPEHGEIPNAPGFVGQEVHLLNYGRDELTVWVSMNSVPNVMQAVQRHPELAERVLEIEQSEDGQGRKTLVRQLEAMESADPDDPVTAGDEADDELFDEDLDDPQPEGE